MPTNVPSRWALRDAAATAHSNVRGAMDEARLPHNASLYAEAHGGDGMSTVLGWILESTDREATIVLRSGR